MTTPNILTIFVTAFCFLYLTYIISYTVGKRDGYEERIAEEVADSMPEELEILVPEEKL